jgi:alpha-glucosidase
MDLEVRKALLSDIPFFGQPGSHDIYRAWRKIFDSYEQPRMAVAEAYLYPTKRLADYVRPDELHQVFNFDYMGVDWDARKIREAITQSFAELEAVGAVPSWVMDNHDSPRVVSRLQSPEKARAFALVTHALPGCSYIYQGEELGLPDGIIPDEARQDPSFIRSGGVDKGRDGARVPLPWSAATKNFGFSDGTPWLPMHETLKAFAVDVEEQDQTSFLNLYRTSLALRKRHSGLGGSDPVDWQDAPDGMLFFKRGAGFALLANTTDFPINLDIKCEAMVLHQSQPGASISGTIITVPSHTTLWLQV